MELKWGCFSLLQLRVSKLPAMCAAWRPWQLPRRASWGIVGFLQCWEPRLNLRLFHYPGQFSESWRQPVLSHFWKTNRQTKSANTKQMNRTRKKYSSSLEKQILCYWAAMNSLHSCLRLHASFRPLFEFSHYSDRPWMSEWVGLFDWMNWNIEMMEEHLKMLHTFYNIMYEYLGMSFFKTLPCLYISIAYYCWLGD